MAWHAGLCSSRGVEAEPCSFRGSLLRSRTTLPSASCSQTPVPRDAVWHAMCCHGCMHGKVSSSHASFTVLGLLLTLSPGHPGIGVVLVPVLHVVPPLIEVALLPLLLKVEGLQRSAIVLLQLGLLLCSLPNIRTCVPCK